MAGSVALIDEEELVSEYLLNIKVTHSERLLTVIDSIMRDSKVAISEIDGFAISIGPGSFTGLRIGVSTVKGLAFAANKPVVGIPTLDALAENLLFADYLICPILDARKNEVYTALYRRDDKNGLQKLTGDMVIGPNDLLKKIDEKVVFLGDGIRTYHKLIRKELHDLAIFAPLNLRLPRAGNVGKLSLDAFNNNNILDLNTFTPLYVRASEAEIKFKD